MSTIAQRISEVIEARGMGNNALDRALGKKQGYTSTMIAREARPRGDTLEAIAKVLEVRVAWLVTGQGERDAGPCGIQSRRLCRYVSHLFTGIY